MQNKKIYLVITPFFPSEASFRGPYIYDQVKALMKDGRYQVVVMMPHQFYKKESDYDYDGVHIYRFASYCLPTNVYPGVGDCLSLNSFNKAIKRIGIHYSDIAIVHAHVTGNAIFANYVKKINVHVKTVLQHHGYDVLGVTNGKFANYQWHKKRCIEYGITLCNKIDLHVGVSNEILKYLEAYNGIKLNRKYVLYNGVDTHKFYPMNFKHTGFNIGCVANFWELKDQITLIKAVEILVCQGYKDLHVIFIGTGYTRSFCENYVQEHKLTEYFEFRNEVDHCKLNQFYNLLDLFVLPSYWDAFGCVYLEAYACGVPFMSAKGTGITEYIPEKDFSKWVIAPHDYLTLAENILYYKVNLNKQELLYPIDINILITQFLNDLSNE